MKVYEGEKIRFINNSKKFPGYECNEFIGEVQGFNEPEGPGLFCRNLYVGFMVSDTYYGYIKLSDARVLEVLEKRERSSTQPIQPKERKFLGF